MVRHVPEETIGPHGLSRCPEVDLTIEVVVLASAEGDRLEDRDLVSPLVVVGKARGPDALYLGTVRLPGEQHFPDSEAEGTGAPVHCEAPRPSVPSVRRQRVVFRCDPGAAIAPGDPGAAIVPGDAVSDLQPGPEMRTRGKLAAGEPLQETFDGCHRHDTVIVRPGRPLPATEVGGDPLGGRTHAQVHEGSQGEADADVVGRVRTGESPHYFASLVPAGPLPEIEPGPVPVECRFNPCRALPGESRDRASRRGLNGVIAVAHVVGQRAKPRPSTRVETALDRVRRRGEGRCAGIVVARRLVGQGDSRLAHPVDPHGGGDQQEERRGAAFRSRFSRFAPHHQESHDQGDRESGDLRGTVHAGRLSLHDEPLLFEVIPFELSPVPQVPLRYSHVRST